MYPSLWGGFPWFNVHEDRQRCLLQLHPTKRASVAQGLIFGGSGHRAGAHTRPAWPKILLAQVPSYNSPTPKWVKAWGDGLLRLEENSSCRDTLGQIPAAASTAGQSATQQLERRSVITAAAPPLWAYFLINIPFG